MNTIKASKETLFVFDIDGTLTDSATAYLLAITRAFKAMGIVDIDTDYDNYRHHTDSYALRYNFERNFVDNYNPALIEELEDRLVTEMRLQNTISEIKGAAAFVDLLRKNDIPFCFATGGLPSPSFLKLQQAKIWYDESILATSKMHETREGFVSEAIEKAKVFYGITNFRTVYSVGDGIWDFRTAQNLSLDFIGMGSRNINWFQNQRQLSFQDYQEIIYKAITLV